MAAGREDAQPARGMAKASWHLLLSACLWFGLAVGASAVVGLAWLAAERRFAVSARLGTADAAALGAVLSSMALAGVMIGGAWRTARRLGDGRPRNGLGDHPVRHPRVIALIAAANGLYVLVASWVLASGPSALPRPEPHAPWCALLLLGVAAVVGPLWEEIVFRGWLWTGIEQAQGTRTAALLTGLLWLALHLFAGVQQVLLLLPLALALAAARLFGRSVRASLVVHATNNALSMAAVHWLLA